MQSVVDAVVYVIPEGGSSLMELATIASAIAAVASTLAAIAAVIYTRKQIKAHERHNRLMATPHLSGWSVRDPDTQEYQFTLENTGIGPAVIKEIALSVRGEAIKGWGPDLIELGMDKLLGGMAHEKGHEMFVLGDVIPPGKKFEILALTIEGESAGGIEELIMENVALFIRYESILGDSFAFDSEELMRQRQEAYS